MKKNIIRIGIIQASRTADVEANRKYLIEQIESLAKQGADLVVLQELHDSLYFCQVESTDNFDLATTIPGPVTDIYSQVAAKNKIVLVTSLFEKRAAGLYHNTAVVFDTDGSMAGKYRKCTSLTIPPTTKSSTSLQAICLSPLSTLHLADLVCWYAGINGIQKQPDLWLSMVQNCSSTLQQSVGNQPTHLKKKHVSARLGSLCNADTQ